MVRIVKVPKLPNCDICKKEKAVVDGRTAYGIWAFMCQDCYEFYGIGIGSGKGQILREVSRDVEM